MNFITKKELYSSRDIKVEAKAQLKGHWKNAILLAIVPVIFSIFFLSEANPEVLDASTGRNMMNAILRLAHGFILTSVSFTMLDFIRNREEIDPLAGAVQAFKKEYFVNLVILKVLQFFYIFLWTLLFIIPGIVKGFSYSQAELIFKDKVDQTGVIPRPQDCLKESERLMYGHRMDLFSLGLSFFGWYILAALSFGLLFIWLTPYIEMSEVIFYENLLAKKAGYSDVGVEDSPVNDFEEVGKDPDDFSDFDDF